MVAFDGPSASFGIRAPLRRSDLAGLCDRVCRLLETAEAAVAYCDVGAVPAVDAVTVDALARLQVAARRRGCQIRLRGASADLRRLIALMGLTDVLPDER